MGVAVSYVLIALVVAFTFERYISESTVGLSYSEYIDTFMRWLLPFAFAISLIVIKRLAFWPMSLPSN
jgi:hypothetical protein